MAFPEKKRIFFPFVKDNRILYGIWETLSIFPSAQERVDPSGKTRKGESGLLCGGESVGCCNGEKNKSVATVPPGAHSGVRNLAMSGLDSFLLNFNLLKGQGTAHQKSFL